ncbi:UDP-3-O-acyl-N-acetylglucosamine deacetylase [Algirhabdus cladophorae]|uniref:UDP-3-O-acyl-N-acetylglucosamine deacetylase n=1 Tax=Algirhabdus cladophorae TaxID=3377108 RepID=UPI003B847E39
MQTTLKAPVTFDGTGLHSNLPAQMVVRPASAEHGIWFRRIDITHGDNLVPATWDAVDAAPLCTRIVNAQNISVSTIEHIMAALAGCGIQNAIIDLDGPEVPIMDGSAAIFVKGLMAKGVVVLDAPIRAIEILKPVEVRQGASVARLEPAASLQIDFAIDFEDAAIGHQHKNLNMANGAFVRELSDSRTFCRQADVDAMHAQGLALGGTLANAVVVDGDQVLSPGGLRHADEAVRHKMLDALGDLALAGLPILGRYVGHRAGHALTNNLLRAVFADPSAFKIVTCDASMAARLPGAGIHAGDISHALAG